MDARPTLLHRRPVQLDRSLEVAGQSLVERGARLPADPVGEPIDRRRRARLLRDVFVGVVEFLPDNDDGERQQHRVENADGRELEARDLVVGAQFFEGSLHRRTITGPLIAMSTGKATRMIADSHKGWLVRDIMAASVPAPTLVKR